MHLQPPPPHTHTHTRSRQFILNVCYFDAAGEYEICALETLSSFGGAHSFCLKFKLLFSVKNMEIRCFMHSLVHFFYYVYLWFI